MSEPISVGDLVVIVRSCCGRLVGRIFIVGEIEFQRTRCHKCGWSGGEMHGSLNQNWWGVPLSWLRRIPPLSELEGEKRDEEITA